MQDLITRLRSEAIWSNDAGDTRTDAADAIEALEAALEECLEELQAAINERYSLDIERARDIARAALRKVRP